MPFPNDENGDVLRRMEANGDNLAQPRDINFTVVFELEESARKFAYHFRALGYSVSQKKSGVSEDMPWDIVVVNHMVPTHESITAFETLLEDVAEGFEGRSQNDGWGCFNVPFSA